MAPMHATVGIFAFLAAWNDFMMPSLITSNPEAQTIPVVQNLFQGQFTASYNIAFASYLMALLPTLLVFLLAQRWVMSGAMRGAVKGWRGVPASGLAPTARARRRPGAPPAGGDGR